MAGFGYGGLGGMYGGGMYGGGMPGGGMYGGGMSGGGMYGGSIQQTFEQERIGYGPGGYVLVVVVVVVVLFDKPTLISLQVRNQYTGGAD